MTGRRHLCMEKRLSSFKFNKKVNKEKVSGAGEPKPPTAPAVLGSSFHFLYRLGCTFVVQEQEKLIISLSYEGSFCYNR